MQVTIAAGYEPHPKQRLFHQSKARFVAVAAGVRGGKTKSATVEFLRRVFLDIGDPSKGRRFTAGAGRLRVCRLRYWVVGPTFQLTEAVYEYILEFVPPELIEDIDGNTRSIWLKGGALIEFRSTERQERLVAMSVNGMLIDEACRCKADAWKGSLRGRLADCGGWALFVSSPLGGRNNWMYREIVSQAGKHGYDSFHWTTADNIAVPELAAEVEHAILTQPKAWVDREFFASWDSFGGTIFDEFKTETHVISEAAFRVKFGVGSGSHAELARRLFRRIVVGVDFGWTSPGAMVVVGYLGDVGAVVLEESYAPMRPILGNGVTTWLSEARRLKDKWGASLFVCDPANPGAINDFSVNGIPTIAAFNDIHLGIRRVAEFLHPVNGVPGLLIIDQCQHGISEARSYQWKSNKDQTGFAETPADGQADHFLDALRYALTELRPYARQSSTTTNTNTRPPGRGPVF